MARANSIISTTIDNDTITFAVQGVGNLTINMKQVSTQNATRAMHHGIIQRVSDAAALSRNTDTGQPASPADKFDAMKRIVDHLNSGSPDWSLRVASGESGSAVAGITLKAVASVQGVSVDEMRQRIERLAEKRGITTRALLATLAKQEAVAKRIAEMRAPTGLDADDLLGEL